ncbi:hypothetical protein FIBSPDRAFT_1049303 [Athelia psychrophila]|uniref:SnoaL-like domain-containing protein n=1 Tax=Athelia psychrophila TaxID=1759441 RepID=A0A166CFC7_9AGAM|nr:hypothetical protein FIBSPDRAFT_940986 [Fibularhizoctonia sp. CBS 109695]KZP13603.1 hypothetical protein FIBSPDRAFT_1049303 [Fibularhizoctonia sp. CBS 109695]
MATMFQQSATQSPQMYAPTVRTRLDLANAWMSTFNHWDLPSMLGYMTEAQDFNYGYMPASLGMAPKSRREYLHYSSFMKNVIPNLEINIISVHDSAGPGGPVVAHVEGRAISTRTGAPFYQEYMMLIYIRSERGQLKIHHVDEFADTRFVHEYFTAEKQHGRRAMATSSCSKL